MPFLLVRQDITKMQTDAIVNAANPSLLGGGGVDGAIHRAAGPELLEACRALGGCETGDAKRTDAFRLPCRYVIHTVGPLWYGGGNGEADKLRSCYLRSLTLAAEAGCESVAFPLISAGAYGYPKQQALGIATQAIRDFLRTREMTVYLTLFDPQVLSPSLFRFDALREKIAGRTTRPQAASPKTSRRKGLHLPRRPGKAPAEEPASFDEAADLSYADAAAPSMLYPVTLSLGAETAPMTPQDGKMREDVLLSPSQAEGDEALSAPHRMFEAMSLEERLGHPDESFSQMLLRLIDERGITDAQCYKKANVDRKLFSKIRTNPFYKPSKNTVLAFALALELPIGQTRELLLKAGYALSPSAKSDIIVEYYISTGQYDVFAVNEALFAFDQPLLGA